MLKNMKIGKKIITALLLTLLIIAVVIVISVMQLISIKNSSEHMQNISTPATGIFSEVSNGVLELAGAIRAWEISRTEENLQAVEAAHGDILSGLAKFDEMDQKYPTKTAVVKESVDQFKTILVDYKGLLDQTVSVYGDVAASNEKIDELMKAYIQNCSAYLEVQRTSLDEEMIAGATTAALTKRINKMEEMNEIIDIGNHVWRTFDIDGVNSNIEVMYEEEAPRFNRILEIVDKIEQDTSRDVNLKQLAVIRESTLEFQVQIQELVDNVKAITEIKAQRKVETKNLIDTAISIQQVAVDKAITLSSENAEMVNTTIWIMLIGFIVAILLGSGITYLIVRMITKPLKEITEAAETMATGDVDISLSIDSKDEVGIMANAFGKIIANIKALAEVLEKISVGDLDFDILPNSEKDILVKSLLSTVKSLKNLMEETNSMGKAIRHGDLAKKADESQFQGSWKQLMHGINGSIDNFRDVIDKMPVGVISMDKDFTILFANQAAASMAGVSKEAARNMKCHNMMKTEDCQTDQCVCNKAMARKTTVSGETIAKANGKQVDISYNGVPVFDEQGAVVGVQEFIIDQTEIKNSQRLIEKQANYQEREVSKLIVNLDKLAKGNLNIKTHTEATDKDTESVGENFRKINENLERSASAIRGYIDELSQILSQMAKGNMDVSITNNYLGDFVAIKNAVNLISDSLNKVLGEINVASDQVSSGAKQVSDSSQMLSQGATEQASSTEEINSSIELIAKQTKDNAEFANQANELGVLAKKDAVAGNEQMAEMLSAMQDINKSSADISKIIKVIDEIAFQTNILALNAAVEAARAGQHGKGFAVVAEEVRNLAARSANAAKETTDLIEGSIKMVESGTEIANNTAESLGHIVEGIGKVTDLISRIADASNEQATGVSQIKQGIDQVTEVTQMNTATAEESASAAEELSGQAAMLKSMISRFRLRELGGRRKIEDVHYITPDYALSSDEPVEESYPDIDISLDDEDFGKY